MSRVQTCQAGRCLRNNPFRYSRLCRPEVGETAEPPNKEFEAPLDQLRLRLVSAEARAESKKKRAARLRAVMGSSASG